MRELFGIISKAASTLLACNPTTLDLWFPKMLCFFTRTIRRRLWSVAVVLPMLLILLLPLLLFLRLPPLEVFLVTCCFSRWSLITSHDLRFGLFMATCASRASASVAGSSGPPMPKPIPFDNNLSFAWRNKRSELRRRELLVKSSP